MKKKKTQRTPKKRVSEEELLETIEIISKKLAYKFKFGYHEIEDMKQQISIFALEGLKNYDHKRPLENFLWTHVRNRLFNFKRDNYQRPDKPCNTCPFFDPHLKESLNGCSKYTDITQCEMYNSWYIRNINKKNLMHLNTIEEIKEYLPNNKYNHQDKVSNNEIINKIEENLNGEYRQTYIKLKNGTKVSKNDVEKLAIKIREILNG
jgi:DNA-directed RNA polymerase specialized sigma24 family protein